MLDKYTKEKGSIMVITVMILAVMSVIVFSLSIIMNRQIDFTKNLDYSLLAYYGAESSLEQALFEARKLDIISLSKQGVLLNNVKWKRDIQTTKNGLFFKKVLKNKSVQVDLFDPDNLSCVNSTIGVNCNWDSLKLEWQGGGTILLTITEWQASNFINFNIEKNTVKTVRLLNVTTPWIINSIKPQTNYRLKIKPLFNDIYNLKIHIYSKDDAEGIEIPIPNYLTIKALGEYKQNKQALKVTVPRNTPLSNLYDYVLFSQEDIKKEVK